VHPVVKLVAQRIALGLLLLFAVSVLIFGGTLALPGDVAQQILGQGATPENLANLREEISIPEFMIGYILIYWLAIKWRIFPSVALMNDSMSLFEKLNAIAIPVLVLTLVVLAHMMRMTRAAILNVMQSAYIETAELKGMGMLRIIRKHAFPNAVAPIVNVVMINMAYLVVGVVVVEVVFAYPGMGQYLVDHVSKRDVPVVQACGLIFAAVYIGLNLIADIVSILANPRLRHPK